MTHACYPERGDLAPPIRLAGVAKDEARLRAIARRDWLHDRRPTAGQTLAAWAPSGLISRSDLIVSGYWPMQSEMDPRPLMARFSRNGARLALPRLPLGRTRAPLAFHLWAPGEDLIPGPFGLMQPRPDAPVVDPDILLVPLLAFDVAGGRLGYGGGYYDRTLQALRSRKAIFALGVAFAGQAADEVPLDVHDQALEAVITEEGWRHAAQSFPSGEAINAVCDTEAE